MRHPAHQGCRTTWLTERTGSQRELAHIEVEPVLGDRLVETRGLEISLSHKLPQHRERDRLGFHVEDPPRRRPGAREPPAAGAERGVRRGPPPCDLIGSGLDPVAYRHDWRWLVAERA